ncbi:hypothetical protein H9P43_004773 [Blastocladiella emersonii ATCC 22665]|nr:hypothetical protein H9P43_004773 [Blastocladiella emersonii ATCC 22665]
MTPPAPASQFPDVPAYAHLPAYVDLITRIRRAEKFAAAVSDTDRALYRQFKFGTYTEASAATAAKPAAAAAAPKGKGKEVKKPAAAPAAAAGKKAAAAAAEPAKPTKRERKAKAVVNPLDKLTDDVKLSMLKRARKFHHQTDESKALEAWYAQKYPTASDAASSSSPSAAVAAEPAAP